MSLLNWLYPSQPTNRKPTRLAEFVYPAIMIAQGLVWLRPDLSFSLSINYDIMRRIGPEEWWGAAWIVLSVIGCLLTLSGLIRPRRFAMSIYAALPLFVGLSFYASNPLTTTAVPFLGVGLAAIVTLIEVR